MFETPAACPDNETFSGGFYWIRQTYMVRAAAGVHIMSVHLR